MNIVEYFFRDATDKRIRRDSFTSVAEIELAIGLKPFIWTARASDILPKVTPTKAASMLALFLVGTFVGPSV